MGKGGGCGGSSETERLQEEKERADQERARAEQERVANLPRMSVNFISPPPATKLEFNVEETAEGALETIAPHYGLKKSDAPLLQLEFSETILTPKQQLTGAGMCDESLCSVLGVQAALEKRKAEARKAEAAAAALRLRQMDIVEATKKGRVADVQLVCQNAPEKVNDTTTNGDTALHMAAYNNSLEIARLLLASKAAVDVTNKSGTTPIQRAQNYGHRQMVALLKQHQQ